MNEKNFFSKLISFAVDRYKVIYLMIFLIITLGVLSYGQIPKEVYPEIRYPYAIVSVTYPGASPEDVEKLITTQIETAVSGVGDIKDIDSWSYSSYSETIIKFNMNTDLSEKLRKINEEVDNIVDKLPSGIEKPTVSEYDLSKMPVLQIAMSGDFSKSDLIEYSTLTANRIKRIPGVNKVEIFGNSTNEVQILTDPAKMSQYTITEEMIVESINSRNQDVPAGEHVLNQKNYSIRIKNSLSTAEEIENIIISNVNGFPIFVKNVAQVKYGYGEKSNYSITPINFKEKNEKFGDIVLLSVLKDKGTDTIKINNEIKKTIEDLKGTLLPKELVIKYQNDLSKYINKSIKDVFGNAFSGLLIVVIVLFFFVDLKESLIVAFVIPLSLLISVFMFQFFKISFNVISLLGLIISIGMLVDNAIVVIESIQVIKKKHGNIRDTVKEATSIVSAAIFSSTLTTISAFIPVAMMGGDEGAAIKQIPIAATLALTASFVLSITVTPTIASRFLKVDKDKEKHNEVKKWISIVFVALLSLFAFSNDGKLTLLSYIFTPIFVCAIYYKLFIANGEIHENKLIDSYSKMIRKILPQKTKRWSVLIISLFVFLSAIYLLTSDLIKKEGMPKTDATQLNIEINLPGGSVLEDTRTVVNKIHEGIKSKDYVESYIASIGDKNYNHATIYLELVHKSQRELHSTEIEVELAREFKKIPNALIDVTSGGDDEQSASLVIRLIGKNLKDLKEAQNLLSNELISTPSVAHLWSDSNNGIPQLIVTFNHQKASMLGLDTSQMSMVVRNVINGQKITELISGDKKINVTLKDNNIGIQNIEDLNKIHFVNSEGMKIPFVTVASIKEVKGSSVIIRKDNARVIDINIKSNKDTAMSELVSDINSILEKHQVNIPGGVTVKFAGDYEDMTNSYSDLKNKLIIVLVIIFIILLVQFDSFTQALVVILAVPMAIIGVAYGHWIFNIKFSTLSMLGIVSLAGISVNDSIVLIDTINQNRKFQGMERLDSIIRAGKSRFIPVLATSVTTIAGVLPLALYNEDYSQMAWTIVFGLMASTILILILVPIFLYQLELSFDSRAPRNLFNKVKSE
ncbi:efflux RND transporter permease subunit [Wukongibacter baidiensis]|uniref:efflux RND transporter permease subunit n=1 Tax=Wukongibacter baidiensis TaxID=1723361 RepID=UPI003D7F3C75